MASENKDVTSVLKHLLKSRDEIKNVDEQVKELKAQTNVSVENKKFAACKASLVDLLDGANVAGVHHLPSAHGDITVRVKKTAKLPTLTPGLLVSWQNQYRQQYQDSTYTSKQYFEFIEKCIGDCSETKTTLEVRKTKNADPPEDTESRWLNGPDVLQGLVGLDQADDDDDDATVDDDYTDADDADQDEEAVTNRHKRHRSN